MCEDRNRLVGGLQHDTPKGQMFYEVIATEADDAKFSKIVGRPSSGPLGYEFSTSDLNGVRLCPLTRNRNNARVCG